MAMANILFGVGTLIVVAGLAVWIAIVVQRAARINRASSGRIHSDLVQLAQDPSAVTAAKEPLGAPPVPSAWRTEPIMFSDDLPTEVTDIATAALADEAAVAPARVSQPAKDAPVQDSAPAQDATASPAEDASPSAPAPSELEAKLAKLDDLHDRGVITDDEHAAARQAAING